MSKIESLASRLSCLHPKVCSTCHVLSSTLSVPSFLPGSSRCHSVLSRWGSFRQPSPRYPRPPQNCLRSFCHLSKPRQDPAAGSDRANLMLLSSQGCNPASFPSNYSALGGLSSEVRRCSPGPTFLLFWSTSLGVQLPGRYFKVDTELNSALNHSARCMSRMGAWRKPAEASGKRSSKPQRTESNGIARLRRRRSSQSPPLRLLGCEVLQTEGPQP